MVLAHGSVSRFPDQGKGLDAQRFLKSSDAQAATQFNGPVFQLPVVQGGQQFALLPDGCGNPAQMGRAVA